MESLKKRYKTIVFDPVQDIGNARKDPDFFLQNNPPPLFLDEIQYAPELLAVRYSEIWRGGHPRLLNYPDTMVHNYFESYMQTYIERDIRTAADIGSLQTFGAFIRLIAAKSATEINHTEIGRELGIDRKTAMRWLELMEATYQ